MSTDNEKLAAADGWERCDPVAFESDDLWHKKGEGFCLTHQLPNYTGDISPEAREAARYVCDLQDEDPRPLNPKWLADQLQERFFYAQTKELARLREENERLKQDVKLAEEEVGKADHREQELRARIATLEQQARERDVFIKHLKEQNALLLNNNERLHVDLSAATAETNEVGSEG